MKKVDLRKELKHWYQPSAREVVSVELPALNYLMIDGMGDPNTAPDYAAAVEALFTVAYTAKFMVKRGPEAVDFGVMPLEGLWWTDDMAQFSVNDKGRWKWTMMIMQPEIVTGAVIAAAITKIGKTKQLPALEKMRFETFAEGRCAQIMHVGPFAEEGPTVEKVHQFIENGGGKLRGKHHEIYLSDIRKAAPAKWKTVIRQPYG